jgi:hypothetical protein
MFVQTADGAYIPIQNISDIRPICSTMRAKEWTLQTKDGEVHRLNPEDARDQMFPDAFIPNGQPHLVVLRVGPEGELEAVPIIAWRAVHVLYGGRYLEPVPLDDDTDTDRVIWDTAGGLVYDSDGTRYPLEAYLEMLAEEQRKRAAGGRQ